MKNEKDYKLSENYKIPILEISQTLNNKNKEIIYKYGNNIINKSQIYNLKYENKNLYRSIKIIENNSPIRPMILKKNKIRRMHKDNYLLNNQSLSMNKTTSYLDVLKSELSKRSKKNNYENVLGLKEKKFEEKKNLLEEKIKQKENKINTIKKINSNNISARNTEKNKKSKMKEIKLKMIKLFKENKDNICEKFERKNESFNQKLKNYFESERFMKNKIIEQNNFSPNKKDFSSSHNLLSFYIEYKNKNKDNISKIVDNSFNNKEKKIISESPEHFMFYKKINILKKLNITQNLTLKERLNKEELNESQKAKSHRNIKKNIVKESFSNGETYKSAKNSLKQKLYNNKSDIYDENKISKELKRPHSQLSKDANKKRILDNIDKIIKNNLYKNKKKYKNEYKKYNFSLYYYMKREFLLNKNKERLNKEYCFHNKEKTDKSDKDLLLKQTITKYQRIMRENYKKQNEKSLNLSIYDKMNTIFRNIEKSK